MVGAQNKIRRRSIAAEGGPAAAAATRTSAPDAALVRPKRPSSALPSRKATSTAEKQVVRPSSAVAGSRRRPKPGRNPEAKASAAALPSKAGAAPAQPCQNVACRAKGVHLHAETRLCRRCQEIVFPEGLAQVAVHLQLVDKYKRQLTTGCRQQGCDNPACRTATGLVPPTPEDAAYAAVRFASRVAAVPPRCAVCVPVAAAPPRRQTRRRSSMTRGRRLSIGFDPRPHPPARSGRSPVTTRSRRASLDASSTASPRVPGTRRSSAHVPAKRECSRGTARRSSCIVLRSSSTPRKVPAATASPPPPPPPPPRTQLATGKPAEAEGQDSAAAAPTSYDLAALGAAPTLLFVTPTTLSP